MRETNSNPDYLGFDPENITDAYMPEIAITAEVASEDEPAEGTSLDPTATEHAIMAAAYEDESAQADDGFDNSEPVSETAADEGEDAATKPVAGTIKPPPTKPPLPTLQGGAGDEEGEPSSGEDKAKADHTSQDAELGSTSGTEAEESSAVEDRPVTRIVDRIRHRGSLLASPEGAYNYTQEMLYTKMMALGQANEGEGLEELREGAVYDMALGNMFKEKVEDPSLIYHAVDYSHRVPDVPEMEARAAELRPGQVLDYFMEKLESHTEYLDSGQTPVNWPETDNFTHDDTMVEARAISEMVRQTIEYASGDQIAEILPFEARHNAWAQRTTGLLLSEGHIALAGPLINSIDGYAGGTYEAMEQLAEAMSTVREEDPGRYRELYAYLSSNLVGYRTEVFYEQNARLEVPLTPGAEWEVTNERRGPVMTERFIQERPITAQLANGEQISLPFNDAVIRTISHADTPLEAEYYHSQVEVPYNKLDQTAKDAIDRAWEAEYSNKLQEETLPHYRRLVLASGEAGPSLHTMTLRDGRQRGIWTYPDERVFRRDPESQIDRPVVSARHVSDGYMVVPYEARNVNEAKYRDPEINFFGPGKDQANAFWVSGSPLTVVDTPDISSKYYRYTYATDPINPTNFRVGRTPRWVIVPIRFYQVETQPPTGDKE